MNPITVSLRKPYTAAPLGHKTDGPRILVFDIETMPMNSWHWRTRKEFISAEQTTVYGRLLSWSAKWLDSDAVLFDSAEKDIRAHQQAVLESWQGARRANVNPFEWYAYDDSRLCQSIWELCNRADMLVAHNGRAFDVGFLQARWAAHRIVPPAPYKMCDTLKVARSQFAVPSRSLDTLVRYFEMGAKLAHTGWDMWLSCMECNRKAWAMMEEYNIQDTLLLQDLYLIVRPWDRRHPNMALCYEDGETRCVVCGSRNMTELAEPARTAVSRFPAFRCDKCGHVMRSGKREKLGKDVLRNAV